MKKKYNSRKWHNWVGIAVSIPTIIVGVTAVLISVQDTFKDKDFEPQINVSWLPAYSSVMMENEVEKKSKEIRASFTTEDNIQFLGTAYGLFSVQDDSLISYPKLYGAEVNCFASTDSALLIGSKKGLFELKNASLNLLYKRKVHSINVINDSTYTVSDNKTLQGSNTIPLHKFVMDMHTGKAFFGKTFEAIWIFLVGLGFSLLGFTGIYMWYDKKRKKAKRLKEKKDI